MTDESVTALEFEDAATLNPSDPALDPPIPDYCVETYWWAYLHPRSVWLFERPWIVNLILWGHMGRLTDAVLEALEGPFAGPVLQVACVYGAFSNRLATHSRRSGARLHLLDVAPIQLANARDKLQGESVRFHHQDSTQMRFADGTFESSVVFFLLHEQPADARSATIEEALRVTRPGGKVIFVDYHRPSRWNPLRYLMRPVLSTLEPFALDLWRDELCDTLKTMAPSSSVRRDLYGGGLYQRVVVELPE